MTTHAFHTYLGGKLAEKLRDRRVVVFYDEREEFGPFLDELTGGDEGGDGPGGAVEVDGVSARLFRFGGSFFALRHAIEPLVGADEPPPVLIYLAGVPRDSKNSALMEVEKAGEVYEPQLRQLARFALRKEGHSDGVIDEVLAPQGIGYGDVAAFLRQGGQGGQVSILQSILPNLHSEDLLAAWLADDAHDTAIAEKGAVTELQKLVESRLGLSQQQQGERPSVGELRARVARHVLINEFRGDFHGEPPAALAQIPTPARPGEHVPRLRAVAERLRKDHGEAYGPLADEMEEALGLAGLGIDGAQLGSIDTFRFEEMALLEHCASMIEAGELERAGEVIERRRAGSFWARRDEQRLNLWELCDRMVRLLEVCGRVRGELRQMGAAAMVARYTDRDQGWWRVDELHRTMEELACEVEPPRTLEDALLAVRRTQDELSGEMAQRFNQALVEADWAVPQVAHQTRVWPDFVEGGAGTGSVAYVLVDAMRWEMGCVLQGLLQERSEELQLVPAIAALPTITKVGMAALLPGASSDFSVIEHDGSLAARVDGQPMRHVQDRLKHLKGRQPRMVDLRLDEILNLSSRALEKKVEEAPLVLVRSQEIDAVGEGNSDSMARRLMGTVLSDIARAVGRLSQAGVERFVITADHGHHFSQGRGKDMQMPTPAGKEVEAHRRCWAGHGSPEASTMLRARAAELGYDGELEFVFPRGLALFTTRGGGLSYCHGGPTLQELVIPVLTLRAPSDGVQAQAAKLELRGLPTKVTNRTFTLRLAAELSLIDTEPVPCRVAVLSEEGTSVGEVTLVRDAAFDRKSKVLRVDRKREATVGVMIVKDTGYETLEIVVLDPSTDMVLTRSGPIELDLL